jgi:hypothetical protein
MSSIDIYILVFFPKLLPNVSALRCRTVDCQSEATTVKPIRLATKAGNSQQQQPAASLSVC